MRYVLVAATTAEAAYVPPDLPLVVTGLGKTAAAAATARVLAEQESLAGLTVVNVGTAGALRPGLSGIFEPGEVWNHEINGDAIRSLGYDPEERLRVGASDVVLASGDVFVADRVVRDRLAQAAHLVDMEGYAVAWTARSFGVPVRLVKHVSDHADEGSLAWPALVDRSARALGEWLATSLPR